MAEAERVLRDLDAGPADPRGGRREIENLENQIQEELARVEQKVADLQAGQK